MAQMKNVIKKGKIFFLLVLGIVLSMALACAVFWAAAHYIDSIELLFLVSFLALGGLVYLDYRWVFLRGRSSANRKSLVQAGILSLLIFILAYVVILQPGNEIPALSARPDAQTWQLESGVEIAYTFYPAEIDPKPYPILYLHGGPGAMPHGEGWGDDYAFLRQFTEDGFNVYLYDQAGSGRSSLRAKLEDYSVLANVQDLEAIRQIIGVEKVILFGQSWGAALAANYLANYPQHVERVIFTSPGEMWAGSGLSNDFSRTAGSKADLVTDLRFDLAYSLLDINPQAAQNLLSQREANGYLEVLAQDLLSQSFCKEDADRVPSLDPDVPLGFNFYALLLTEKNQTGLIDPRPLLSNLDTPALILKGECDYIPWEITMQYRQALPNARLIYIEDVGHLIWGSQWETATQVIRAFLNDEPLPLPEYDF